MYKSDFLMFSLFVVVTLDKSLRSFASRPIVKLQAVSEQEILVSLSGNHVLIVKNVLFVTKFKNKNLEKCHTLENSIQIPG